MTAAAAVSRGPAAGDLLRCAQGELRRSRRARCSFNQGESYMVHASRREQPGMAEIHTKDADIVYVLDGTATLVTGGTAVDAKLTDRTNSAGRQSAAAKPAS